MIVAAGTFDGVHLGHAAVIRRACREGRKRGEKTLVFTFENHPRAFFGGEVECICSNKKRRERIIALGADEVYFQVFDREFSEKTPEEFISFLKAEFNCSALICGEDFRFGKGACGVPHTIDGIDVIILPEIDAEGEKVSSSRIRSLIRDGHTEQASRLLGYCFSTEAPVGHGKGLGKTLGYPTLNQLPEKGLLLPGRGVYATQVLCGGCRFCGVTNIGVRPSVDDGDKVTVETFLIHPKPTSGLYGELAEIFYLKRLREERRFENLVELTKQIASDCTEAALVYNKKGLLL